MRIFISYSSKNRQAVTALAADLERLGHDVWYDHELTGGHAWWKEILTAIRDSDLFVVALTPQLLDSFPCQLEGRYAEALNKRILPVMLSHVETALIPAILSELQFVDYRQRNPNAVLALGRALGNLPPAPPLPSPLPKPPEVPLSPLASLRERVEAPAPLSREDQATLLMEIRELMSDRATAANARVLLQRLRQRNDLLANVAREADDLSKSSGRSRRTFLIAAVVVVALVILGSETLSVLTLSRKTTTPTTPTIVTITALTSVANQITPSTNTPQPAASTNTPFEATRTPTQRPTQAPSLTPTVVPTRNLPPATIGVATLTSEAFVSGSVTLDCKGFVGNGLTFRFLFPNSGTPDTEIVMSRVTDGTGVVLYEQPITVTTLKHGVLSGRQEYTTPPAHNPVVFTLSSTIQGIDVEKTYYLASGSCPDIPRVDMTPVPVGSLADVQADYLAIGYSELPPNPVPSNGGLRAKIRYKLTSVSPEQLQASDIHLLIWVGNYADPACTVRIPVKGGLGIASQVEAQPLSLDSGEITYEVAYVAIDTPYIALQANLYRNSDSKVLISDYSTSAGCWKVSPSQ